MQLSGCSDHAVWKVGNILAGDFSHLHRDSFIKRHVLQHRSWIGHRDMKVIQRVRWDTRLFHEVDHLSKADGGHTDMIPCGYCLVNESRRRLAEPRVGKKIPDCR